MTRPPDDPPERPPATGQRPPGDGWQRYEPAVAQDDERLGIEHRRAPRHEGRGRRRRGRLAGYLLVAVLALVIGTGVGYARAYFSDGAVGATVTVVIKEGSSLRDIARQLESTGVVKHANSFVIRAEGDGYGTKFLSGTYTFHVNEPYPSLVAKLLKGTRPPSIRVTIPEGTTLRQAAEIVSGDVPRISEQSYLRAARDHPSPFKLQGYKPGTTLEGMLFPATYDVPRTSGSARTFVGNQLSAFEANFAKVDMTRAHAANLTDYDVVIIASMVEREARLPKERPIVAAVIWNRLRKGMLLQIDATIQYALGKTKPVLTYNDLKIDSPYNTYEHLGLPPTPISNPGLAALEAAADPSNDKYLYYVARNDGTGGHYFSTTYEQFKVDEAKARANGQ